MSVVAIAIALWAGILRKPAQRAERASRTVEVGGDVWRCSGRFPDRDRGPEIACGAGGGRGEYGEQAELARRGARGAARVSEDLRAIPGTPLADLYRRSLQVANLDGGVASSVHTCEQLPTSDLIPPPL